MVGGAKCQCEVMVRLRRLSYLFLCVHCRSICLKRGNIVTVINCPIFLLYCPEHQRQRPKAQSSKHHSFINLRSQITMPSTFEWVIAFILPGIVTLISFNGAVTYFHLWLMYMFLDATYGHLFHMILLVPARRIASVLVRICLSLIWTMLPVDI